MFGLENGGNTLIFMSRHFDETMTILILHFLRFGAPKILTGDYFVLRINQIIYHTVTSPYTDGILIHVIRSLVFMINITEQFSILHKFVNNI